MSITAQIRDSCLARVTATSCYVTVEADRTIMAVTAMSMVTELILFFCLVVTTAGSGTFFFYP